MAFDFDITDRHFIDKQFFVVHFDNDFIKRKTFVEFGPLEATAAEKKHKESGHPVAWTGAGTVNYSNITMKRGLGLNAPPWESGVLDADLETWWQSVVDGIDPGGPGFKKSATMIEMTRDGRGYGYARRLVDMVPTKYKPFEGDANSDDICLEEMEVVISRWFRLDDSSSYGYAETGGA